MTTSSWPFWWKHDPGPCPVDEHEHHGCVSADYAGTDRTAIVAGPIVPVTRIIMSNGVLTTIPPAAPTAEPTPAPETFTSATYKRAVHGRQARTKGQARP